MAIYIGRRELIAALGGAASPGARPFEKKIVGVTDPRPCDELIDKSAIFPGE